MNHPTPIIILGGQSLVTPYLVERLRAANLQADILSRNALELPKGFKSISLDILNAQEWHAPEHAIVISLLPLSILARSLPRLAKAQSIIALGSTCRFSKANSNDPNERAFAENLEMAENILKPWCLKNRKVFTLLRPTLIYDGLRDQNITRIARIIRRSGLFPVAAPASGLRQPIHADDVAHAITKALGNASVYNKTLNIAGGEVLTYRRMIEAVFNALGVKPRLLMLPASVLQYGFR
ncbi:MAG: epimerase, partial [Alphaproteobacteria bacterium]|nr:epimerase [Alphaproteobacteria bacterium]